MGELSWAADTAKELLEEFGKPIAFYRETPDNTLNSDTTPWKPDGLYPEVPPTVTAIGMTVPYTSKMIDGSLIRVGDVRCYVPFKGLAFVPRVGDYVIFSSTKYKVVGVDVLEPGVDRVLYDLQLRT